ncbi:MAG: mechanosensitive ion channel family protein [Solobacterium sp.]|nr:mechanosensitive ion channel family protein [Solobacterium sp.]
MSEQTIWDIGSEIFSNGILNTAIYAVVVLLWTKAVTALIKKAFKRHPRTQTMPFEYLRRVITFILYTVAVISILAQVKVLKNLGLSLLGATSAVTVIVGLAAQATFGNFISGFILSMYQPFKVGDFISLPEKGIAGQVQAITFRHTTILSIENTQYVIPNSLMDSAVIENRAFGQPYYKRRVDVTVAYHSDVDLVKKLITDAVTSAPEYIDTRTEEDKANGVTAVTIRLEDFGDSGLKFMFFMVSATLADSFNGASRIRQQLLEEFNKHGISIPYQTLDVHVSNH